MTIQQPPTVPTINEKCPEQGQSPLPGCDRRAAMVVLELERMCREQTDPNKIIEYRNAIASIGKTLAH